ncbi:MAG: hypothetical protein J6T74_00690 [Clostridia bacterium]|nr:hypothetical protein [Clostridia bacterium]
MEELNNNDTLFEEKERLLKQEKILEQENVSEEENNENATINYDIYNALNLLNEDLGQSYLEDGFNPFGGEFLLDEDYILDILENNVEGYEISTPDFIEAGNKETAKAFETSAENALLVIEQLTEFINDPKTPEMVKRQMRKQILYILCRNQLIKVYLKRIKDEKDTLLMYQKMSAINWQLSKRLEDSYKKEFNAKKAAEELAKKAKEDAEEKKNKIDALKEEAKSILETNKAKSKLFDIPLFERPSQPRHQETKQFQGYERQAPQVANKNPDNSKPVHLNKVYPGFRYLVNNEKTNETTQNQRGNSSAKDFKSTTPGSTYTKQNPESVNNVDLSR